MNAQQPRPRTTRDARDFGPPPTFGPLPTFDAPPQFGDGHISFRRDITRDERKFGDGPTFGDGVRFGRD
ncbi:hypothetical protein M3B76_008240 [Micrococcus luteus]|nr:hypothetical protein [Micrococcus luteus]